MRLISHQISFHCEEIRNTIFAEEIVYLGIFLFSLDQKSRFKERKYQSRRFFLANFFATRPIGAVRATGVKIDYCSKVWYNYKCGLVYQTIAS